MKKCFLFIILIFIVLAPVVADGYIWSILGFFGTGLLDEGGICIQVGRNINIFGFMLDTSIGWSMEDDRNFTTFQIGGLADLVFSRIFMLGVGGGVVSVFSNNYDTIFFPYIRSIFGLNLPAFKVGLYYDYCFNYKSKYGIRFGFSYDHRWWDW
jgi:hypothetical protein